MKNLFSSMSFLTIDPIMESIYDHNFVVEFIDGTLPVEKFVYYLQQDSLYLVDYAKALALVSAKVYEDRDTALVLHFAEQALVAERELHNFYFKEYRVPAVEGKGPACYAYCSHLLERASMGSAAEGMAALLPCFWIYREVGNHIRKLSDLDNPYFRWIESYSCKDFSILTDKAVELTDKLAADAGEEERRRMFDGFLTSSRYEYCFWDDGYHLRTWPI